MKKTNDIKNNKGITMVSLIITIAVLLIISSITVYTSLDRFEINNYNKMKNDIELLSDKVSNYYLKYNGLPVLRDSENNLIKYTYTTLEFDENVNDNENYYILDLGAMEGISLNYGKEGFENPNTSKDVYIINENSHRIYYVQGIELNDTIYYTNTINETAAVTDEIPPSKPEIKMIFGRQNNEGIYNTKVVLEFVPGRDNISGIEKTTYSLNNGEEIDITTLESNIFETMEDGSYEISLKSYDNSGNVSESVPISFNIEMPPSPAKGAFVYYDVAYTDKLYSTYNYTAENGWRIVDYTNNGDGTYSDVKIMSTGVIGQLSTTFRDTEIETLHSNEWVVTDEEKLEDFKRELGKDGYITNLLKKGYSSLETTAGLYYNFEILPFTSTSVTNKASFVSVTKNGITFDKTNTSETTAGELFDLYGDKATIRIITLPEVNKILERETLGVAANISESEDTTGMFRLDQLKNLNGMESYVYAKSSYYLATPGNSSVIYYIYLIKYNGEMYVNYTSNYGLRPLVCLNTDVKLLDENGDGIWEIKF